MACALCQLEKPLRKSHIVPEFMYQDMYDEKHRFFGLSNVPARREKLFQKGLREELLCDDCEQLLSKYEDYAAGVFYGGTVLSHHVQRDKKHLYVQALNYKKLKIFFLSLLWRFGVTKLEHLKGARLGKHQEQLRNMLLAEQAGKSLEYPCFIVAVTYNGKRIPDLIVAPRLARMEAHSIWTFVAGGYLFNFYVSSHSPPSALFPTFLRDSGEMMISIKEITEIEFLYKMGIEIASVMKERT